MPKIIVQFGGEEWTVDLREGVNVAGRSPQAAIPIRDASMSREHCEIVLEGTVATVVDRGSMNGTLVNGTRMERKVLAPGDKIQIGKAALYFEDKKAGAAPAPASAKAARPAEPVVGLDDYSVWRRESGSMGKVVIGLVALGILAVGAVFLFKSLRPGETVAGDPANLLGTAGWMDPSPDRAVVGWAMKPGQASKIQVVEGSAKQGKSCLQLEKSGAANDLVAEVLYVEPLAATSAPLEFSAWVQCPSSGILPALKVAWLGGRKGPVLSEVTSEPAPGSGDWTQLSQSFTPPPGATHVQLSLLAAGRAGRILFDDVKARHGSGSGSVKSASLGRYSVTATPAGVLSVAQDQRRILNNVQVFLASDKEGMIPQLVAMAGRVETDDAAKKLTAAGKVPSPIDLRPVEFEIEALGGKDNLLLGYHVRGDALKQLDRLGISLLLPGAVLKGDYSNPVARVWFQSGGGTDSILEISAGVMRVTADWVPEARRVLLAVQIPKGATEMTFSFLLKSGAGGPVDPKAAAEKAIAEGRMSDAMELYRDLFTATREEKVQNELLGRLRALEETEAEDWQSVQAQRFMAELVGLKPLYEVALHALDQYEKRWPRGKRLETAKAERAKLATGQASAAEDRETLRAHRLLDRAEEHRKEGRKMLARELCETVRKHYPDTSAAPRAAELLKTLGTD